MHKKRIIGDYSDGQKGPLLLCLGGMHGNEPAGVEALETLFHLLELEKASNPAFAFFGRMIGLRGNLQALQMGKRYMQKDLNRQFTPANIQRVMASLPADLQAEDKELYELLKLIKNLINDYQPEQLVVLDLHTTTADGGIFSVASDDPQSVRLGVALHAPVIKGLLDGIQGTTLHYFKQANTGFPTVALTFEAGQHQDKLSVNRMIAAIINCMSTIGSVRSEDVENRHNRLLLEYAQGLPKVAELIMCHHINEGDHFRMRPGYRNFQPVEANEILAFDRNGPIRARESGCILMPHYQNQGEDGFFLIRKV